MAGRHIRYNVAGKYFESSTSGDGSSGFAKLDLSGHTEIASALAWPIGSIYTNITGVNPSTELGFGTWAAIAAGRCLVGLDSGQTEFDTVRETGGAKTHTLAVSEIPAHAHPGSTVAINDTGHGHALHTYSAGGTTAISVQNSTRDATQQTVNLGGVQTNTTGITATPTIASQGGGGAHNNLQPYYVVHFWERTA